MSEKRDYYEVLEVPRNANDEEIKKAFRRLALRYHPDRNRNEGAADRFKEINEAYQVLSDSEARARYNQFGHAGVNGNRGHGFEGFADFGGFGDIFESFFGGAAGTRTQRGSDLEVVLDVSFRDAVFGVTLETDIRRKETCSRCDGNRGEPGTAASTCRICRGSGQVRRAQRTLFGNFEQIMGCPECLGVGKVVSNPCTRCKASGVLSVTRKVSINVPQGVDDGTRIVMRGHGDVGEVGGDSGDLYVRIRVEPDPIFTRRGNDIYIRAELHVVSAILGGKITVPTLDGEREINIPAGVQTGQHLFLPELGVPVLRGNGIRGDQIVQIAVVTPRNLTSAQERIIRKFADAVVAKDRSALDPVIVRNDLSGNAKNERVGGIWGWLKDAFIGG